MLITFGNLILSLVIEQCEFPKASPAKMHRYTGGIDYYCPCCVYSKEESHYLNVMNLRTSFLMSSTVI